PIKAPAHVTCCPRAGTRLHVGTLQRTVGGRARIVCRTSNSAVEHMKLSVVITTHNRREELRRTLIRLSELRPMADEILVCADGCTDGTGEMVRSEFQNCALLENEASRGSIYSRDRLLRAARGEIVVSFDDDSYPIDGDFL